MHWYGPSSETSRNRLLLAASLLGAGLLHTGFTLVAIALAYTVYLLAGRGRGRAAWLAVGLCLGLGVFVQVAALTPMALLALLGGLLLTHLAPFRYMEF